MPHYFGQKGHNKQTWQFRKTHPQLRVLQKEAKACMSFFDQIKQALHNQQSPEGTPPLTSKQSQQTPTTSTPPEQISLQPRTKTAKNTCVQKYPKAVVAQSPDHQKEDIYPSTKEILSVTDYMKAVRVGRIPKGHNHQQIEELSKLPHANQTKVILLTYETRKPQEQQEPPKST